MKEPKVIIVVKILKITLSEVMNNDRYIYFSQKVGKFLAKLNPGDLLSFEHPFIYHEKSMSHKGFDIKMTNLTTMESTIIKALYLNKLWYDVITEFEQIEL